jgi:hypothetical protein
MALKFKIAALFGSIFLLFPSCAKVFLSPDVKELAGNQKIIAIIPPSVSIAPNKKIDAASLKEQQKTESINFQREIYSWMLKRKMQGKIDQEIQELQMTNAKLERAGYPQNPLSSAEICELLGVDGIMTSNFGLSKPISEGAAIALAVLVGFYGSTNEIHATLSINDCKNKKLIWNYDHKFSGGVGSTPARLVDGIMRQVSKKMPYARKN